MDLNIVIKILIVLAAFGVIVSVFWTNRSHRRRKPMSKREQNELLHAADNPVDFDDD